MRFEDYDRRFHGAKLITVLMTIGLVASACRSTDSVPRRVVATPIATVGRAASPASSPSLPPTPPAVRSKGAVVVTPTPEPTAGSLADAKVRLVRIATLNRPLAMAARANDASIFVAEKGGVIRSLRGSKISSAKVLDISGEVSSGGEQGLLGLAFSPDGQKLYVNFTDRSGDTHVREYAFSNAKAVVSSARELFDPPIAQPYPNHNGGDLVFGPDGFLYIGLGDGGSAGDPGDRAQNLNNLLGKMLRIDPKPSADLPYTIPSGNPFVGKDGRDEIWAFGLRNPWRYSFDRSTGDLLIADVGQSAWEEIDFQAHDATGGDNYGWHRMEGTHPYKGGTPPAGHHAPIYQYSHGSGNCAVTGGFVYRGTKIKALQGAYVFGDFCVGALRAFIPHDGRAEDPRFLGPQVSQLSSFGQDNAGNLYVLSLSGGVYRIDRA